MLSNLGGGRRRLRRMKIREAAQLLTEEEAGRLVNDDELKSRALANAEQNGIVFLDEIDKITSRGDVGGPDVSRQGVQRDRKSTRLNSSHGYISYAVFCLKKKKNNTASKMSTEDTRQE